MSQPDTDKARVADRRSEETRSFVRQVRAATRRKYTPEEKIRIVLEGFRREVTVNDLCRREGISPHSYYAWTKEFMEAGKERLSRDTVRDATRQEINNGKQIIPTIVFPDGSVLVEPSNAELADKLGIQRQATRTYYELIIVGGGPASLTTGIYTAREGIKTLIIERAGIRGTGGNHTGDRELSRLSGTYQRRRPGGPTPTPG